MCSVHVSVCVCVCVCVCVLYDLKNSIIPSLCLSNHENIKYFKFSRIIQGEIHKYKITSFL